MTNLIAKLQKRQANAKAQSEARSQSIGWFLDGSQADVIYDAPRRVRSAPVENVHAKSAARCPATIAMEGHYFEIKCPIDLNIAFVRDPNGKPALRNLAGNQSTVRNSKLDKLLFLVSESEWRYKNTPILQLMLPYVFVADAPTYIQQTSAFMHYYREPLPGTTFCGRFPIHIWPRQLMWAFEWHDPSKPLIIRRGTPLCYASFETEHPDRPVRLVEVEKTPELARYMGAISGAVNYVNQTFSLFERAEALRPESLIVPKGKS